jgi:hypothetical protein
LRSTYARKLFHKVWIFLAHVLRVAAVYAYGAILKLMYLGPFAIVLVFTCEALVLETVQYLTNCLGGFCEHGLQRHPRSEFTVFFQAVDAIFQKSRYDTVVCR